jgi:hypothetical protein
MASPQDPKRSPGSAPKCDTQLPLLALAYRKQHQLMSQHDFSSYNVTVWRLEKQGKPEYISGHNVTTSEANAILEQKRPGRERDPVEFGLHAETLLAGTISTRMDVLRGETRVAQIFTERIPCSECHKFLKGVRWLKNTPRYFYLTYSDREWQKQRADGNWGLFLMDCYRLR